MPGVIVIGAGLLGAAVAHALAGRGVEVTVLEAGRPGEGTSGASFGWVNAQDKSPAAYFELNAAGVAAYPDLAAALGGDWYHDGGDLAIARGPEAIGRLRERVERHAALGYRARLLDRAAVAALEPGLALDDGELLGAHWEPEGWVDGPALVAHFLAAARERGARVLAAARVVDVDAHGGRVRRVRLASGDSLRTELLVIAAGTTSQHLARLAGIALPMAPSPGMLGLTGPVATGVRRVVHGGDVSLRPDRAGRVLVASRAIDASLEPDRREIAIDDARCRDLHARAAALVPELREVGLESVRIGVRSVPIDGQPAVGFAPGLDNAYVLVSHSGVTLAPVLGRLVAEELLGRPQAQLEPYRPGRFAAAGASPHAPVA